MSHDTVSITITRELYMKIKYYVDSSQGEFKTVEEYVEFVLRGRVMR